MSGLLADYDYYLPAERIAQAAIEPRDHARLLRLDRATGTTTHGYIYELPDILRAGDVLVLNDTKVFRARVIATAPHTGAKHEIVLLRPLDDFTWEVLCKNMWKRKVGDRLIFSDDWSAEIVHADHDAGLLQLRMNQSSSAVFELADQLGSVPLPHYIERQETDLETYQTTFAQNVGSVAAPTAGRHFTPELFASLRERGVEIHFLTLHVGIGTFQPIRTDKIDEHQMHEEWVNISPEVAWAINLAKGEGRRIIAVGTTVTRALEGVAVNGRLPDVGYQGMVNAYIMPGYKFQIIDGLITNFHLPRTSLLVLVSALAGREAILSAYKEAVEKGYRFYSLGDAMFII